MDGQNARRKQEKKNADFNDLSPALWANIFSFSARSLEFEGGDSNRASLEPCLASVCRAARLAHALPLAWSEVKVEWLPHERHLSRLAQACGGGLQRLVIGDEDYDLYDHPDPVADTKDIINSIIASPVSFSNLKTLWLPAICSQPWESWTHNIFVFDLFPQLAAACPRLCHLLIFAYYQAFFGGCGLKQLFIHYDDGHDGPDAKDIIDSIIASPSAFSTLESLELPSICNNHFHDPQTGAPITVAAFDSFPQLAVACPRLRQLYIEGYYCGFGGRFGRLVEGLRFIVKQCPDFDFQAFDHDEEMMSDEPEEDYTDRNGSYERTYFEGTFRGQPRRPNLVQRLRREVTLIERLEEGSAQGDAAAQYSLGLCYQRGTAVEKDEKKAFEYLGLAATQGLAEAQYEVGLCYQDGTGVGKEEEKAVEYFRLAAKQGFADAQCLLGMS